MYSANKKVKMALAALLKRQNEIKSLSEQLLPKFTRTGDASRKEAYFGKRLTELRKIWDEFEENNVAIEEIETTSDDRKSYEDKQIYKTVIEALKVAKETYENAFKEKFPDKKLADFFDPQEALNKTIIIHDHDDGKKNELIKKTYTVRGSMVTDLGTKIMANIDIMTTVIELEYELGKMT